MYYHFTTVLQARRFQTGLRRIDIEATISIGATSLEVHVPESLKEETRMNVDAFYAGWIARGEGDTGLRESKKQRD